MMKVVKGPWEGGKYLKGEHGIRIHVSQRRDSSIRRKRDGKRWVEPEGGFWGRGWMRTKHKA